MLNPLHESQSNAMALNQQLLEVPESATLALADRVRRLKAAGRDIIPLQTGDPDFATPQPILDAALQALKEGYTHYSYSRGLPELRDAIARKLEQAHGAHYDPETEILVTCGGVHALFCAAQAILNPGDEVLIPDPAWMTYVNVVKILRGRPVRVRSLVENSFWPTPAEWEKGISTRTVALVVNSPNNPTGSVAEADYLAELNAFAAAHNLYVISDEVYHNILFDGRTHTCFASLPDAKARTLLIGSLSKTYAMTGWRVGYLAGPAAVIGEALKGGQNSVTHVAPFIQKAAAFALTDPDVAEAARRMTETYARRREQVLRLWQESGPQLVRPNRPQGAFYFFLDVRPLGEPSHVIAERLIEEALVAMVPGAVYGPSGEGFLRMTIAAADAQIEEGFRAFLAWTNRVFSK